MTAKTYSIDRLFDRLKRGDQSGRWTALGTHVYFDNEVESRYRLETAWAAQEMARFCNATQPPERPRLIGYDMALGRDSTVMALMWFDGDGPRYRLVPHSEWAADFRRNHWLKNTLVWRFLRRLWVGGDTWSMD